jgi:putative transposase
MSKKDDRQDRDRWARLRFSIVGPLLAAPPERGQLRAALQALSEKHWQHPSNGQWVQFGLSTIRRWLYAAAKVEDPVAVLKRRQRSDRGTSKCFVEPLVTTIKTQYQKHPSWSFQLHYDNLRVLKDDTQPFPSYATFCRYMILHGMTKQPAAPKSTMPLTANKEVRSYEADHVNALWHTDFHHGSRQVLTREGNFVTPMLLGVIDDHSRLVCHLQWYLDVTTESLVHGVSQAFQKRGLPRMLLSDNGSAMIAEEFTGGLHDLSIVHATTLPYSPEQNAKVERLWGLVEGRLMAMLEGVKDLTLEYLNRATQAWVELEYNRHDHAELGTTPLERYLNNANVGRECPSSDALRRAFRRQVTRTQRRSDGTVRLEGKRFEVPARYRHVQRLCLRYARWDLSYIDLIDDKTGSVLCPLYPLDKSAYANGLRRELAPVSEAPLPSSGPAPLLTQLLADYAASGLPPAYIPTSSLKESQ